MYNGMGCDPGERRIKCPGWLDMFVKCKILVRNSLQSQGLGTRIRRTELEDLLGAVGEGIASII
jgi:hypothetical protein